MARKENIMTMWGIRSARWSDIDGVTELVSLWSLRVFGFDYLGRGHTQAIWSRSGFSPEQSCRLIENNAGKILAYANVSSSGNGYLYTIPEASPEALRELLGWFCNEGNSSIGRRLQIAKDTASLSQELSRRGLIVVERMIHAIYNLNELAETSRNIPKSINFIPFTDNLNADIHSLVQEAFRCEYYQPRPLEDWLSLAQIDRFEPKFWKVIATDNHPVAVALGRLRGDTGHVTHLAVDKNHRNRGLGEIVLLSLLSEFKVAGATSAFIQYAIPRSMAAHRLYQRIGFSPAGEILVYAVPN